MGSVVSRLLSSTDVLKLSDNNNVSSSITNPPRKC